MSEHERIASLLHCPDPACAQQLSYQGQYGPRGSKFARYLCPACSTSYPESRKDLVRQLSNSDTEP